MMGPHHQDLSDNYWRRTLEMPSHSVPLPCTLKYILALNEIFDFIEYQASNYDF